MIIEINEKQEVIFTAEGIGAEGELPEEALFFRVDVVPERVPGKILCFDPESERFYQKDRPTVDVTLSQERLAKAIAKKTAERKRSEALKWLSDNDWKVNKHTLGEWSDTDERWLAYLEGREQARAAIDDAETVLHQT